MHGYWYENKSFLCPFGLDVDGNLCKGNTYFHYLYLHYIVTQKLLRKCGGKQAFMKKTKIKFVTALDPNKCLKQNHITAITPPLHTFF